MERQMHDDVKIGKFEILATYTYSQSLLHGASDAEAKERGIVAAIMGAKAKAGQTVHTRRGESPSRDAERR
jgi:hypothetical protein